MKVFALFIAFVCIASAKADQAQGENKISPHIETRTWNPFMSPKSACTCVNNNQCSCCFLLTLLSDKGCLVSRADDKQIQYDLKIADVVVFSKTFPLSGRQLACVTLPSPFDDTAACLGNDNTPITGGTSSCARLGFRLDDKVITAVMGFDCVDVTGGGKMAIGKFTDTKDAGHLTFRVGVQYLKWFRNVQKQAATPAAKQAILKKW